MSCLKCGEVFDRYAKRGEFIGFCPSCLKTAQKKRQSKAFKSRWASDPQFRAEAKIRKKTKKALAKAKEWSKNYKAAPEHKEAARESYLKRKAKNPELLKQQARDSRQRQKLNNPFWSIKNKIRCAMRRGRQNICIPKDYKTFDLLGKTPEDYQKHFESFMGKPCVCGIACGNKTIIIKDNYHDDHIIPNILANTLEELVELNQPENFQRICKSCNMSKSNVINGRRVNYKTNKLSDIKDGNGKAN